MGLDNRDWPSSSETASSISRVFLKMRKISVPTTEITSRAVNMIFLSPSVQPKQKHSKNKKVQSNLKVLINVSLGIGCIVVGLKMWWLIYVKLKSECIFVLILNLVHVAKQLYRKHLSTKYIKYIIFGSLVTWNLRLPSPIKINVQIPTQHTEKKT